MARFTVDPGRLNFNVDRKGKEYNLRVLQRAQSIFSTLLSLLPSNYTSTITGPNYTLELKAVAVEIARIELALEDVDLDLDYARTRSEFLYGTIGYLCFLNNRLPSLDFSDTEFRQFLLNLIRIYFQGAVPKSMKDAVGLFLTTDFQILENFLLVRQGTAGLDISDQFGFQIDVATGNRFPSEIFDLQSSIRIILDIIRPAHTLFSVRFIFQDDYEPNEPTGPGGPNQDTAGRIADSMRWKLASYYYEDYRRYWAGLRDRDRLGARQCHTVTGELHSTVNAVAGGMIPISFAASGSLEVFNDAAGILSQSFVASGAVTVPASFVSGALAQGFVVTGTGSIITVESSLSQGFVASGAVTVPASLVSGALTQAFAAVGAGSTITAGNGLSVSFAATGALAPFEPTQLTQVTAWLRAGNATSDVNGISILPDQLNANPAVQSVNSRKPSIGTSSNGLPIIQFATNDVLSWPLHASNNATTKLGFAFWMRQPVSALEIVLAIYDGTGGASARKFFIQTNSARRILVAPYISGGNGRQCMTAVNILPVAGTWTWIRCMYDSSGATEADRAKIYVDGVLATLTFSNLGAGGTLGVLPTVTGNLLFGDLHDAAASVPFNGDLGPNIYVLNDELTAQQDTNLKNYQKPT